MARTFGNRIPALAAGHIGALAVATRTPMQRSAGAVYRWRGGDSVRPTFSGGYWLRSPAIVMRGWQPREIAPAAPGRSFWALLSSTTAAVFRQIAVWQERAQSRQDLTGLDDHALHDIGLDRASAQYVANQPFWRKQE